MKVKINQTTLNREYVISEKEMMKLRDVSARLQGYFDCVEGHDTARSDCESIFYLLRAISKEEWGDEDKA
jgi:hypothetical protein